MITVYGIKNCSTVKQACRWLDAHQLDYQWHDLREQGVSQKQLQAWVKQLGWEAILNRRSTTWRQLSEQDKTDIDAARAVQLMLAQPTLIKRPVLTRLDDVMVGFNENMYAQLL